MRIKELTLAAWMPDNLRKFYSNFGFTEIEALGDSDGYSFIAGHTRINFVPGDRDARYHFAFNVLPDQLDGAIVWAGRSGAELLDNPESKSKLVDFPNWRARAVYFFDPAGNIVELIARAALPRAGNAPKFSASSIPGLSEIGIVCDDVASMRRWITDTHGINAFARQTPTDDFSAMGNDEGLLLLVPAGRPWLMGNFDSKRFPLAITLTEGEKEVKLMLP